MWQETKHGLYKEFVFINFEESVRFFNDLASLADRKKHYPRVEIETNVVKIWVYTNNNHISIEDDDRAFATEVDGLLKDDIPKEEWTENTDLQQEEKIKLYADGGSRGNPGPSASGFVLLKQDDKIIVDKGVYLGITTNNQAEYTALKLGLEEAKRLKVKQVDVRMDSLLVVNQMRGIFKVKNRDLWPIHSAIKELEKSFERISYTHVPRALNKLADAAVNRALDQALGISR